uniref:Uncharacterized protein n=1 Tax=Arundo donax TaxID=35708 RepID=A0A0A9FQ35_ARUDO
MYMQISGNLDCRQLCTLIMFLD